MYVLRLLQAFHAQLYTELQRLKNIPGRANHEMRLMLALLNL